jgi:hypothetical protein
VVGVFLLAGLLLFIAGELAAETSKEACTKNFCYELNIWDQPDTLDGGGGSGEADTHDDSGDPDEVDVAPPVSLWFVRWFISTYYF